MFTLLNKNKEPNHMRSSDIWVSQVNLILFFFGAAGVLIHEGHLQKFCQVFKLLQTFLAALLASPKSLRVLCLIKKMLRKYNHVISKFIRFTKVTSWNEAKIELPKAAFEGFSFLTSKRKNFPPTDPVLLGKKMPQIRFRRQAKKNNEDLKCLISYISILFVHVCFNLVTIHNIQSSTSGSSCRKSCLEVFWEGVLCHLVDLETAGLRKDGGWIMTKRVGKHTNHTKNMDHIWFQQGQQRQLVYIWWGSSASYYISSCEVCERRSAENAETNSKRTFLESLHASLLLFMSFARQRHSFEQLYLLHLSGSSGSSVLTFRDASFTASSSACFMVFE